MRVDRRQQDSYLSVEVRKDQEGASTYYLIDKDQPEIHDVQTV